MKKLLLAFWGVLVFNLSPAQKSVLSENFNSMGVGSKWYGIPHTKVLQNGGVGGSRCLEVEYIQTNNGGSERLGKKVNIPSAKEYTLSYDIYFDNDWTISTGGKYHGLVPDNTTSGCKPIEKDGWSVKAVFDNRKPYLYTYHQAKSASCGDKSNSNAAFQLSKGKWYALSIHVKMNSADNKKDGFAKLYIDGKAVATQSAREWRSTINSKTQITKFYFSTFLGASPSSGVRGKHHVRFDNFDIFPGGVIRDSPGGGGGPTNTAPTVTVTSPVNNTQYTLGETINLGATATDTEGAIEKVNFKVNGAYYSQDPSAPYTGTFNPTEPGTYVISARAFDLEQAATEKAVNVTVVAPKGPYGGSPILLPGVVELENYDLGGQGVSFMDVDNENKGAVYRTDGVDIAEMNADNYSVGWTSTGEWLEYTVDVENSALYDLNIYYSSGATTSGDLGLEVNGKEVFGAYELPVTGDWNNYTTITKLGVELGEGEQVMRFKIMKNGYNLDKIEFKPSVFTSILDDSKIEITVYPNPSETGVFKLSETLDYEVYDVQGSRLLTQTADDVDLSAQPRGVYILHVGSKQLKLVR